MKLHDANVILAKPRVKILSGIK